MYTAFGRFGFQMLVLLACVIWTWSGPDKTPTREVVELVSVVYKPARAEAASVAPSNAPPVELSQTSTSARESSAEVAASPKRGQGQAPAVVQDAKVMPSQEPAPTRSAKKKSGAAANEVKEPCRPPACRSADHEKQAATKRADTRQPRKAEPPRPAEPPVPAVFAPVRRLGLYLQARLGVEPEGKAAPGSR